LVETNNYFCPCKRQYKWDPHATIDFVEYNWIKIPRVFDSLASCALAYRSFHEEHITHIDPLCFQIVVFCDFFKMVYETYNIIINVNSFDTLRPKF